MCIPAYGNIRMLIDRMHLGIRGDRSVRATGQGMTVGDLSYGNGGGRLSIFRSPLPLVPCPCP